MARAGVIVWALLAAVQSIASAAAGEVRLEGPLVQGGLVIGHTEAGARVSLDGRPVRVAADGLFLIGFDRDAPKTATLRIEHPDGGASMKTLAVARRDYKVQRIDGLPERQVTPGPKDLIRIKDDSAQIARVRARYSDRSDFVSGFAWPTRGTVSGVYGSQRVLNGKPRRPHYGVDVVAPRGTPVVAAADGVVALVHQGMFFTGKTLMIDHGRGLTSVYVHLDDIRVRVGDKVRKGDRVGSVGMTGRVTGPHLHWGVNLFDAHLDPALLTGPMPTANDAEGQAGRP